MKAQQYVGTALMEDDGIVMMMLHAQTPNGDWGVSRFYLRPGTADYDALIERVGGLQPGEKKPVPSWE